MRTSCVTRSGAGERRLEDRPPAERRADERGRPVERRRARPRRARARPARSGVVPNPGRSGHEHEVLALEQRRARLPFAGVGDARVNEDDVDNRIIIGHGYPARGSCFASSLICPARGARLRAARARAGRAADAADARRHVPQRRSQFTPHGRSCSTSSRRRGRAGSTPRAGARRTTRSSAARQLTAMQKRVSRDGDRRRRQRRLLRVDDGRPSGILIRDGVARAPARAATARASASTPTGTLRVERVDAARLLAGHRPAAPRRRSTTRRRERRRALHAARGARRRPRVADAYEVVSPAVPAGDAEHRPRRQRDGAVAPSNGRTPIPPDGAVLQARGVDRAEARGRGAGRHDGRRRAASLNPDGTGVVDAIGGGPVDRPRRQGRSSAREAFPPASSRRATRARRSVSAPTGGSCSSPSTAASPATASG